MIFFMNVMMLHVLLGISNKRFYASYINTGLTAMIHLTKVQL